MNPVELSRFIDVTRDIKQRWGLDFLSIECNDLIESAFDRAKQHTPDHVDCPACKAQDDLVKADLLGMADQAFPDAAAVWQRFRRNSNALRQRTHESVDEYISALSKFFSNTRMSSINPGMLRAYQLARKANAIVVKDKVQRPWRRTAGHSRINHELNLLSQMLGACNEWEKLREYYFPLGTAAWSPRQVLTENQEEELFKKVAGYPEAELAYCVAAITNNTTASGMELRGLKLENIYLRPSGEISEIYIPPEACKNDSRPRKIALNKTARWAVARLAGRNCPR